MARKKNGRKTARGDRRAERESARRESAERRQQRDEARKVRESSFPLGALKARAAAARGDISPLAAEVAEAKAATSEMRSFVAEAKGDLAALDGAKQAVRAEADRQIGHAAAVAFGQVAGRGAGGRFKAAGDVEAVRRALDTPLTGPDAPGAAELRDIAEREVEVASIVADASDEARALAAQAAEAASRKARQEQWADHCAEAVEERTAAVKELRAKAVQLRAKARLGRTRRDQKVALLREAAELGRKAQALVDGARRAEAKAARAEAKRLAAEKAERREFERTALEALALDFGVKVSR